VILEDYEHGVAFCGHDVVFLDVESEVFKRNDITYVINAGHLEDEEVLALTKKAEEVCASL
jgi:hypothetical protein